MKYTKTSTKALLLIVSKINNSLHEIKNIRISDLIELENFFIKPLKKFIEGTLTLKFSSQKRLTNGTVVQLSETIEFHQNNILIYSSWYEEYLGQQRKYTDFRIEDFGIEPFIPYQVNYVINAIYNILYVNKGSFEINTDQFIIVNINKHH